MELPDADALGYAVTNQDSMQHKHEQLLEGFMGNSAPLTGQVNATTDRLSAISDQFSRLTLPHPPDLPSVPAASAAEPSSPVSVREPHMVDPEPYAGDPLKCKPFLL